MSIGWFEDRHFMFLKVKVKEKIFAVLWRQEEEQRYRSTLSLTLTLSKGGWLKPRPGSYTRLNETKIVIQEVGWATGQVWMIAENISPPFPPYGIRFPDRPASSELLYERRYSSPHFNFLCNHNLFLLEIIIIRFVSLIANDACQF
jgi:hypothetical protein